MNKELIKELEKAMRDSVVYGHGILEVRPDGSIASVPYRQVMEELLDEAVRAEPEGGQNE